MRAERFSAEYSSTTYLLDGSAQSRLYALASGIEIIRFHGFGNDTELGSNPTSFFKVTQEQYHFEPSIAIAPSRASALSFGFVAKLVSTDTTQPGTLIQQQAATLYGAGSFGQLGAWADVSLDFRDRPVAASRGFFLRMGGRVHPALWDVDETFGDLHGEFAVHLTAPIPVEPSLAVKVGGKKVFGSFPFYEAAYVGAKTIRGYSQQRFAGDAALYGNMELRLRLADFFVILPGTLGVFGLADAGRVYVDGASPGGWHKAFGGGIWLSFLDRLNTASIAVAKSPERTSVQVGAGFFF
jgi:outer membrane protein assembly factor BamA